MLTNLSRKLIWYQSLESYANQFIFDHDTKCKCIFHQPFGSSKIIFTEIGINLYVTFIFIRKDVNICLQNIPQRDNISEGVYIVNFIGTWNKIISLIRFLDVVRTTHYIISQPFKFHTVNLCAVNCIPTNISINSLM